MIGIIKYKTILYMLALEYLNVISEANNKIKLKQKIKEHFKLNFS